jgi:hypothetical protein
MDLNISHQKNPAEDWDISASAKADKGEKIGRAQIVVNESSEYDETFNPPLGSWQKQLSQKGRYPGDNKVSLIVTNDKNEDTRAEDSWN